MKKKALKCIFCGLLVVGPFFWSYGFCPHCGGHLEECLVDGEKNPDSVNYEYSIESRRMYVIGVHETTTTLTDVENLINQS